MRPDKELFESAQEDVSAFDEAFELKANVEDEDRQRKRVYWKDIIQREELKV